MSALEKPVIKKMTVAEFMEWYETQEGKWELHDGIPVRRHDPIKGHSERIEHIEAKLEAVLAMRLAIDKAGKQCHALTDGVTVPISDSISYIPDALVYCGDKHDGKSLTVPNPVIIVEVLSPSTAWKDVSSKLADYFTLDSVKHYLIIDPVLNSIMHHYREGEEIRAEAVKTGSLVLDPPGISLDLDALFS